MLSFYLRTTSEWVGGNGVLGVLGSLEQLAYGFSRVARCQRGIFPTGLDLMR